MKKILLFIYLCLAFSVVASVDFSAVCPSGQRLYYVINLDERSVSLYYPGDVYGYTDFEEPTGDVIIPDTVYYEGVGYAVCAISNYAFYNCSAITSVQIPNTVNTLGEGVFMYCSSLTSVNIPNSVESVGDYVFYSCSSLDNVVFPDALEYIGDGAFAYCTSLSDLHLPEALQQVGLRFFISCKSLTRVVLPDGVNYIGESAFAECTNLEELVLPNGITCLEKKAFYRCIHLPQITLPGQLRTICRQAFSFCTSLESITLPASVDTLEDEAFSFCNKIESIVSEAVNPPFVGGSETFYNINRNIPVTVPAGSFQRYSEAAYWQDFENLSDGTVAIDPIGQSDNRIQIQGGRIQVNDGEPIRIYDAAGRLLSCHGKAYSVPRTGIYFVQIGNAPCKKIFVAL